MAYSLLLEPITTCDFCRFLGNKRFPAEDKSQMLVAVALLFVQLDFIVQELLWHQLSVFLLFLRRYVVPGCAENLLGALLRIKEVIRRRVESSEEEDTDERGMTQRLEDILRQSSGETRGHGNTLKLKSGNRHLLAQLVIMK